MRPLFIPKNNYQVWIILENMRIIIKRGSLQTNGRKDRRT